MKLADLVVCRTVCSSRDNVGSRFPTAVAAVYIVFMLLCCGVPGQGAKLLLVPLASESHIAAFTALSTALEQHGGLEVHMVSGEAHKQVYTEHSRTFARDGREGGGVGGTYQLQQPTHANCCRISSITAGYRIWSSSCLVQKKSP
jgi:hypothetical protein